MTKEQQLADKVKEIAVFCIEHRGRCWPGWSANKIFSYLSFHALSGTLFVCNRGNKICGVGIAWTGDASDFIFKDGLKEPQFSWKLPEPGNALMVCDVFGSKTACAFMWKLALNRWPNVSRIFTHRYYPRRNQIRMVELSLHTLNRLFGGIYFTPGN